MKFGKKGFTLVELIVVIIIIGILAAIAAPSMTANVTRARRQEAIAAMGAIRTAYRLYTAEKGGTAPTALSDLNALGYIVSTELNGPCYDAGNYTFGPALINATATGTRGGTACNMNVTTGVIG
ncbi:MAG: prepilin-type N-terminal cleavage/methylation domain-containing protein, partial [Candidatus Omnitrophota bacterium]|nr:prepilin-type N-terminal cleavage/methylation domain-containing protein [Candidatus Omnitrophota bacterium]